MSLEEVPAERTSVARGTAYGLVADITTVVSAFGVSVLVARFLGPTNRGVYALALVVATLISLVGDFGLSTSGLVYGANRRLPLSRLHGMAVLVSLAAAALGAALLLGLHGWLARTVLKGLGLGELCLVAVGIAPTLYAQVAMAMLTGLGQLRSLSALRTFVALAAPAIMLPLVWASGGDPFWAVAGWLGAAFALALPMAVLAARRMGPPRPPSREQARTLLGFGLRAWVGTISHHGFLRLDVLFISARSGPTDVGQYTLSSVLAERISLVGSAVYSAGASHVGGRDRRAAEELVARLVRLLVLVLVPVAVVLALLAWPGIPLVFGSAFRPAVTPFLLLLPGTVCLTIWYVVSLFILATLHRPGATTAIQAAALAVSLPLYYFAVREWGMTGAAVVSSCVYAGVMAAGVAMFRRHRTSPDAGLVPGADDLRLAAAAVRTALARAPGRIRHA